MDDLISRQAALDKFKPWLEVKGYSEGELNMLRAVIYELENLPDAEPEIIRCKDCKHWNLQVGNVKGDGLGSCDFHNVNLVTGEGFCYWADRRGEAE